MPAVGCLRLFTCKIKTILCLVLDFESLSCKKNHWRLVYFDSRVDLPPKWSFCPPRSDVKPTQTGDEVRRYVASGGNNLPTQVGMGNQFGCFLTWGLEIEFIWDWAFFWSVLFHWLCRGWNSVLVGLGFLRQEYDHWNGEVKRKCKLGGLTSLVSVHGKFQDSWLCWCQWQWVKRTNWDMFFASCAVYVWNDVGYSLGLHEKFWSWTVDRYRVDGIWWIVLLMVWFFDNDNLPVISVSLPCWSSDSSLISR